jgi:thymidylate kinase
MKISFTGTGCSGKSTLLKKCTEYYGDRFEYIMEVTRPLARKGFKINEEGDDATQKAIIDAHIENNKLDDVIMDRCIVDGYIYTTWLYGCEKVSVDTHDYAWSTFNNIINDIDIIFYCLPLKMEDDGQRSTSTDFQKDIDDMMKHVLIEDPWKSFNGKLITLEDKPVEKRFNDIKIAIAEHEHTTTR